MASFNRCDNCKEEFNPRTANAVATAQSDGKPVEGFFAVPNYVKNEFCSWKCVSEYATARALIESE